MRFAPVAFAALILFVAPHAQAGTQVVFETTLGKIVVELDEQKAPITTKNFLAYVDAGFYDGVIFHRVIKDFVVQAGGFDASYQRKTVRDPIKNEGDNGLLNKKYTLSMARTPDPNSATSQFFINLKDNRSLDHRGPSQMGYAVFARVVEGQDVVDEIGSTPTKCKAALRQPCAPPVPRGMFDVPETAVVITKAHRK